jgi:Tfp pilus assembly protein PilV
MPSRARCSGVTLTEVVVASALLLISIIPLLKVLTTTHGMDRAIQRKSWSLLLAQQELERIRARSIYDYDESFQVNSQVLRGGFLCTVSDDGHPTLRTLAVTVGFDRNGNGVLANDEVEVSLTTAVACRWPGPQ